MVSGLLALSSDQAGEASGAAAPDTHIAARADTSVGLGLPEGMALTWPEGAQGGCFVQPG